MLHRKETWDLELKSGCKGEVVQDLRDHENKVFCFELKIKT